ncbi:hypothetical protein [Oscillatoria sp. FACHB-1406]|uniref:hypothetical protein n=1 Tax=Oscillatoria sp. FACHB-1406 TaxID=2692846 RepID=UPI00168A2344|nr:hypothetical protein [Oscillatoria sp. FACHB-1406]MBD2577138.1 hypothetical protein [Oscillatoria sp. FACHB-1406]
MNGKLLHDLQYFWRVHRHRGMLSVLLVSSVLLFAVKSEANSAEETLSDESLPEASDLLNVELEPAETQPKVLAQSTPLQVSRPAEMQPEVLAQSTPLQVSPPAETQPEVLVQGTPSQVSPPAETAQNEPSFPLPAIPPEPLPSPAIPATPASIQQPLRILAPETGTSKERSTNLIIQYATGSAIAVRINGNELSSETATTTEAGENNTTTQVFYSLPLKRGDNEISVSANGGAPEIVKLRVEESLVKVELVPLGNPQIPADGRSTIELEGTITDEDGALLSSDAIVTLSTSAGEFLGPDYDEDEPGFQTLVTDGRFRAQLKSSLEAQRVKVRAALYKLGNRTDFTLQRGQSEADLETYANVEFITNLRPSLVSGYVDFRIGSAGTNYWGSRSLFLNPDLMEEGYRADLSGAMFATGSLGEWLFTGAVNSERPLNQTCDGITRLFRGPQFCEQQYPVYGDSSTVDYTTPSINSFYARIERTSPVQGAGSDYFMWGDYRTQEFARASQQFTGITRELNGFKSNYNLGNLQLSTLFSPNAKGFQRDTIAPDGTSGYYFLSRRNLVPGGETLFLETEEINRPGTVLDRKQLYRGPDYEIDYDRGTILFRRPMFQSGIEATEGRQLAVTRRIVATYQYEGNGEQTFIYGGRAQYNFSFDTEAPAWLGATYYKEDLNAQEYTLYGADFLVGLGKIPGTNVDRGRIIGEYAHSDANNLSLLGGNSTFALANDQTLNPTVNRTGSAYRLEFQGNLSEYITAKAYYRSVEANFINNATISYTPGQTRYGGEIAAQLSPATTVRGSYEFEENFGYSSLVRTGQFDLFNPLYDLFSPSAEAPRGAPVNNELRTLRAGVQQKIGRADLGVEYVSRLRTDDAGSTFDSNSSQIVTNLHVPIICATERWSSGEETSPTLKDIEEGNCDSSILAFRAQNETNISGNDPLYPNRTTVGLDWVPQPGTTIRLAQQFISGGLLGDRSLTSLSTQSERKFGEDTTVTSRYSILSGIDGVMGEGAIGFNHRMTLAPGLRASVAYERIFSEFTGDTAAGSRFVQPYAFGQSASSLGMTSGDSYSVGLDYTASPDFKASARLEQRFSSYGNNTVISAAAAGKISPALTGLLRFQQASSATPYLQDLGPTATLRLGLAYRDPNDDRFNALLRYEYRSNPTNIPETLLVTSGSSTVDHVLAMEAIYAPNWQWEFYAKYALRNSTTFLANNFSNTSFLHLGQVRATYRFAYQWDATLEARAIGQPTAGFTELGWAAELGFYPIPDLRVGVGYAFGSVDDRDFSGYRSKDGIYFGVTLKVNELFGGFGRQEVVPPQQRQSEVQPVAVEETKTRSAAMGQMQRWFQSEGQNDTIQARKTPLGAMLSWLNDRARPLEVAGIVGSSGVEK